MTVIDDDRAYNEFMKLLKEVGEYEIYIGILGDEQGRQNSVDEVKDPVTVAEYASWNEFGVRNKANTGWKIPPRSFLRSTIDERQQEYVLRLSNLISAAIGENANGDDAETIVGKLAESAVGDVKQKIVRLRTPPNAPYTIRKKKSTNPLIDTGRLLNSIVHKIVKE